MRDQPAGKPHRLATAAVVAALGAWLVAGPSSPSGPGPREARADLPSGTPVFSNPLQVDNAYHPVRPGTVQVYGGRDGREAVVTIVSHVPATRDFDWNGGTVACRAIRESAFLQGRLLETSENFYAQAEDGSVYAFGEISSGTLLEDADPADVDPPSAWVVGSAAPGDPEGTLSLADPFLFMPSVPAAGDVWTPKALPGDETEIVEVLRIDPVLVVPGGRIASPLRVLVRSSLGGAPEVKWYGPGKGEVQARSKGERYRLLASGLGNH